jgi:hypothetical protein
MREINIVGLKIKIVLGERKGPGLQVSVSLEMGAAYKNTFSANSSAKLGF